MSNKPTLVWLALQSQNHLVGRLWCHQKKGRQSASFEYDKKWLEHPEKFALDPALTLTEGAFQTQNNMQLFGAIGDSAPDRWGRLLMRRANQTQSTLLELDYLLGVNDESRQGALRFSQEQENPIFLTSKDRQAIPPLIELPKLLNATEHFLQNNAGAEDIRLLLAPGSSLGGARPKASVRDTDSCLAIAKFPKHDDEYNMVAWEAVALTLAQQAGVNVPDWRLEKINNKTVLITRRFDREGSKRIPFLSAMSMLGAKDNEQRSYIEIAYALAQYGANPKQDMEQLWRRMVFNILIANTDDHLRNHGFLYEQHNGWILSPAYDLNPTPLELKPRVLSTAIDFNNNTGSLDLALSVASEFRLTINKAKSIISDIKEATAQWHQIAKKLKLEKHEIELMSSAFNY